MRVTFGNRLEVSEIARIDQNSAEIYWQTENPFYAQIYSDNEEDAIEVIIPRYFVTDFCSVPKIPFAYLMYGGIGNRAGVLHDALYSPWNGISAHYLYTGKPYEITRDWADDVLRAALIACYVPPWKARMMWLGVRAMGWRFFHGKPILDQGVPHWDLY